MGHVTLTTFIWGYLAIIRTILDMAYSYSCTEFENSGFSCSRNIKEQARPQNVKMWVNLE